MATVIARTVPAAEVQALLTVYSKVSSDISNILYINTIQFHFQGIRLMVLSILIIRYRGFYWMIPLFFRILHRIS